MRARWVAEPFSLSTGQYHTADRLKVAQSTFKQISQVQSAKLILGCADATVIAHSNQRNAIR